jgi:hypothetical protein
MKRKRLYLFLKKALTILLAVLVMAGTLGFSYKAHYCHDKLSGIAFFTELGIQKSATCGCKDDESGMNSQTNTDKPVFHKKSCCSNLSYFNKLNIEFSVKDFTHYKLMQPAVSALFVNTFDIPGNDDGINSFADTGLKPVPLSGRKLVLYLNQQRIPLIS